jgi:hypothetical protein
MNVTQLAAWIGAFSGLGSLVWNIYTKVTAGPKIRVTAFAVAVRCEALVPTSLAFAFATLRRFACAQISYRNLII